MILMPGPGFEVATVNQIYRWLVEERSAPGRNRQAPERPAHLAPTWTAPGPTAPVRQVLTNEKYIGNNVYNRHSFKLKKKHVDNPPEMWIRKEGAFDGIVPVDYLHAPRRKSWPSAARSCTDAELLDHLQARCTPNAGACPASSSTRPRHCPVPPPTSSALAA